MHKLFAISLLILMVLSNAVLAEVIESRPLAHESRIRFFVYKPDHVYKYTGYYNYQSSLKFSSDEQILTVSMGDTSGWQIEQTGTSRLFLKPLNRRAFTNMTIITNKRLYQFEMHAAEAESISDPNLVFETRFVYNDDSSASLKTFNDDKPDFSGSTAYNFNYTYSGAAEIAPIKIFDDGEFTYFEFRDKNAEIPAIFQVDSKGYEGLVNYRVSDNYVIVERVTSVFTLRHGADTICVFNEARPYVSKDYDKKSKR